jgi:hypothetical protein
VATIVVGGSGRNVGKTALVCGLIAGLTEFRWIAVKLSAHDHGKQKPVWEETIAGDETDTARYLTAGAERALLVTAEGDRLGTVVRELMDAQGPGAHLIFESNQVLNYVRPDVCLAVDGEAEHGTRKPSFRLVRERADAIITRSSEDRAMMREDGAKPTFELALLERPSEEMLAWARRKLRASPGS